MEIIVNMACGLANRMFQYSYYLFLKKQGYEVAVDFIVRLSWHTKRWNGMRSFLTLKSGRLPV